LDSNFNTNGHPEKHRSILHIDRLNLTFKHTLFSSFRNTRNPDTIIERQKFGDIELVLDNRSGSKAYYHAFAVYFKGSRVGKLLTASKIGKPDIEFDYEKNVLYSNQKDWWFEIFKAITTEMDLLYNNINYIEICLDTTYNLPDAYGNMHANSIKNKYRFNSFFLPFRNVIADVIDGGNGFRLNGSNNRIHIYNKSLYCEDFINEFFQANGFVDIPVYRLECRLNWNYLKSLINKKNVLITPEILLDEEMLATIFEMSVKNKLTFYDLREKTVDHNRNAKYQKVSLLDNINLSKAELLKFEAPKQRQHYKTENTDEEILRKTYYLFLETGNEKYFRNIRHNADAAHLNNATLLSLIQKFNQRYRGDRLPIVLDRMEFVINKYSIDESKNLMFKFLSRIRESWWKRPPVFLST
jgi:hypothetical protein